MFRTVALSVVFCVFSYVIAKADFTLTVNVTGSGTVTSPVLNLVPSGTGFISTSTNQTLSGIAESGQSSVTLTGTGIGPTAATANYTITEGSDLILSAVSSSAGTKFKHWLDFAIPSGTIVPGTSNSNGSSNSASFPLSANVTGVFEARPSSELSYEWTIGTLTAFTSSSATDTVLWSTLSGLTFGTPISSSLKVSNGTQSNTQGFNLTINPLGGGSAAVPEPSSLLLLISTGLVAGGSSRRFRGRLTKLMKKNY
jgi:hypothetical protein